MKQPLLTDRTGNSSYFTPPSQPSFNQNTQDVSWKMRFPNSRADLWNTDPCGDPIVFGIRHYDPVTLLCMKRCLSLAHRHASQNILVGDKNEHRFQGFLMGSTANTDDEKGIVIDLDRFDPGTIRSDGTKTPSTPLPGDVIIPVIFTNGIPQDSGTTNIFSMQDYENAFRLLHHQVSSRLSVENTSLFPIRLHCFYDRDRSQYDDIDMELHWVSPCISNSLRAIPVKPVPIIPTALAKNLCGPLNLSTVQNSSKTGYISMNQSRKLLLVLDSDPKSRSIPTVGIWVSGVLSVHSPIVWLACMRYLHSPDIYERITADGQFLLVLYSLMSKSPLFFQVTSDDNEKLNFDLLYTQQSLKINKQPSEDGSDKPLEFCLEAVTADCLPDGAFKERELFLEALENSNPFLTPQQQLKQQQGHEIYDDDEKENNESYIPERGRQPKKASHLPQSILRATSGGRRSTGRPIRPRSSSNGVSFSLAVDDSETDATPMPLPSPHPSIIHQSPGLVKPSVPELSIIFDENYPAVTSLISNRRQPSLSPTKRKNMSQKIHSNSPGIRSPLKNINNLSPANRGVSPQEYQSGPIKPLASHYYGHPVPKNQPNVFFPNAAPRVPVQRRSHSASECVRGATTHIPHGLPPRPMAPHRGGFYSSTPSQGYRPNIPATIPSSYPNHPPQYNQPRSQAPGPYSNKYQHPSYLPQAVPPPVTYPASHPQMAPRFKPPTNLIMTPSYNSPTQFSQLTNPCITQCFPEPQPTPLPQGVTPAPTIPAESPAWMKQLPPEAYRLLMQQDAQLKMLQAQIQKLIEMQENKQEIRSTSEISTSTDLDTAQKIEKVSMGVNTGTSLYIPSSTPEEKDALSSCLTSPMSIKSSSTAPPSVANTPARVEESFPMMEHVPSSEKEQDCQTVTPNKLPLRCESQCTQYPASEFASIHLDESNLREIATANNEDDIDVRSLASSLKAVDLPALETSTEQSSFSTPVHKINIENAWNAQDSPVLGESASMCVVVPPINLNKSLEDVENEEQEEERDVEPKDENFMKNLLSQVRDMLKKADIDGASELSSENSAASTPQRVDKKGKPRKSRSTREDRVVRATKKQLKKMGVKLNDDAVDVLSSAVTTNKKKNEEFTYTLPEPLIPRLNYHSILAGATPSESIYRGPSSTDLSMHANAIALKYLSNEQLEEIAALSKLGKNTSEAFSPLKSKSGSSVGVERSSVHDMFSADARKSREKNLPGMSLVSPCNMSLATRKYMEKYGLIDRDVSSEDEEEDEGEMQPSRPETPNNPENKRSSNDSSPVLNDRRPQVLQPSRTKETEQDPAQNHLVPVFPQPEPGFTELKMNLGDTMDRILPFLDDLGRHRQQTPSSGTNGRDSRSGTRSSQTGSSRDRMTSVSERAHQYHDSPANYGYSPERIRPPPAQQTHENYQIFSRSTRNPIKSRDISPVVTAQVRGMKQTQDNEVSQVLSPELLRAVADSKRLTQTPGAESYNLYNNPPLSHRCSYNNEEEYQEDFLAGTWPRNQFKSRSESEFKKNEEARRIHPQEDRRRLSSSPRFPGEPQATLQNYHQHSRKHASPTSSKLKRIRAINESQPKQQLEDLKEVEWNSENRSHGNYHDTSEEEPILTSRVTEAFREKEGGNTKSSEEKSEREDAPHFLQHLQQKEHKNFLDMEKIQSLPNLT